MKLVQYFILIFVCMVFSVELYAQITMNKTADMFFGTLEFDASHSGNVKLGTNGSISLSGGSTGLSHYGGGNAASVDITGTPADVIEIKCKKKGTLRLGNKSIVLKQVEVTIDTGVNFGSGNRCLGTGNKKNPVVTVDLSTNPTPTVLMGGKLLINNGLISGTYDTQNSGGKSILLRVIYQ